MTTPENQVSKYLCLQRSLAPADPAQRPSPAQMQEMYGQFMAWQETFKDQISDMGGRVGAGQLVTEAVPADGPFVEVKELIGGYMIVEADTLEGAIEVARGCPGLVGPRSGVEVMEIRTQ